MLLTVADTPFAALPILEFDDHMLCQTKAIARYLAHKYGPYPFICLYQYSEPA